MYLCNNAIDAEMDVKEIHVPVPWGYIAVKAYGESGKSTVLTLHGLHDNAGTFDRLLPLLPRSFYYLSVDLPSHGKSSPFPPYTFITDLNFIFALKLVTDYFGMEKYTFMGHCRGGIYLLFFTQLYPNLVEKLIIMDAIYMETEDVYTYKKNLLRDIALLIKANTYVATKNLPIEYTHQEAVDKLIKQNKFGTLTKASAEILLKRITIQVNDKHRFSVDPRLKAIRKLGFDWRFALQFLNEVPILHHCLFVIASTTTAYLRNQEILLDAIKGSNKNIRYEVVNGGHYVHLNYPERVAPLVELFLISNNSKL